MILAALWSCRKSGKANIYQKENVMKRASARHILVASKEVCENLKAEMTLPPLPRKIPFAPQREMAVPWGHSAPVRW
jgi:hypothetical protein